VLQARVVVALLTALAVAPAAAHAGWRGAEDVSPPGGVATGRSNAVAAAADGRFVVAWTWAPPGAAATTQVEARRIGGGHRGATLTLASGVGPVDAVRLWPAPAGRTVATWASPIGPFDTPITLRTIGPDDRLGPPVTITEPGDRGTGVVAVPRADGTITVAWIDRTGPTTSVVKAREISPAGVPGPVSTLTAPDGAVEELVGAADMDRGVLLAYDARGTIYGQRITETGAATRPSFQISPQGQTAAAPQIVADGTGGGTALWVQGTTPASIWEVAVIADDKLSGADQVSSPAIASVAPSLAQRNGSAVIVWQAQTPSGAVAAGRDPDGTVTTLSPSSDQPALLPEAAIDRAGNGYAVWQGGTGAATVVQAALFGRRVSDERAATLSTGSAGQAFPHIAVAPDGRAMASWVWTGFSGPRVQIAEYTPPWTRMQIDHPSATVSADGRLRLSVRCNADDVDACAGGLRLRRGPAVVARRALHVPRDRVRRVSVRLDRRGRALLARGGRLRVRAVVWTRQAQTGRVTRVRRPLTLRLANLPNPR
jgi:hypothetical protein